MVTLKVADANVAALLMLGVEFKKSVNSGDAGLSKEPSGVSITERYLSPMVSNLRSPLSSASIEFESADFGARFDDGGTHEMPGVTGSTVVSSGM